jgi:hypothetical protein
MGFQHNSAFFWHESRSPIPNPPIQDIPYANKAARFHDEELNISISDPPNNRLNLRRSDQHKG